MHSPEEIEKAFKKKLAELKERHNQRISDLTLELERCQFSEASASYSFKNIAKSLRSLKVCIFESSWIVRRCSL